MRPRVNCVCPGYVDTDMVRRDGIEKSHDPVAAEQKVVDYAPEEGVRIQIVRATDSGVAAVGSRGSGECAVFLGNAVPPRPYVRAAGIVDCET